MAGTAKEVDQGIEFSVYTFEKTKSAADQGKWQMQGTQTQMADALKACLLYTSPSPRDEKVSRMPSSA